MSASDHDPTLRRAFAELRDLDGGSLPEIDAVLRRPSRHSTSRSVARSWIAVVAVAVTVVATVLITRRPPRDVPAQSISEWRAPTDVLLRTPGVELLQTVPALRSSLIDESGPQFTSHNKGQQ